jgi:hypothetical protein
LTELALEEISDPLRRELHYKSMQKFFGHLNKARQQMEKEFRAYSHQQTPYSRPFEESGSDNHTLL